MTRTWSVAGGLLCMTMLVAAAQAAGAEPLRLNLRSQVETAPGSGRYHSVVKPTDWDPARTAIVICDMWDDHYCRNAARRVAEMAPRMNQVIARARQQGVLIIHCPSGCMDKYADTPQRQLALQAPPVETEIPLERWCYLDKDHEAALPIDDSEPCDDEKPRERIRFYSKQIDTLEIKPGDAITDNAQAYYLMRQRGITNVIIMGVHTNMCVLGRPFGIRQMVYQGQNVALMRDLTDSMYDPRMAPYVSHFTGNDLVNEHVERHWCPTITSADILGGKPFRFPRDNRQHLVVVMAEDEYETARTLPPFALSRLGKDFRISLVYANARDRNDLPGIDVLAEADVALWSIRRRTLPPAQLAVFRTYLESGRPLVAVRTTSHAFCLRTGEPPAGLAQWPEFDREILGGYYQNHHGNKLQTFVRAVPGAAKHPIMQGVRSDEFRVLGSLYKSSPLGEATTPLLSGRAEDVTPHEPVAWTNRRPGGGRVFYTSLGHPDDFDIPDFRRLLRNAVYWAADLPVPTTDEKPTPAKAAPSGC